MRHSLQVEGFGVRVRPVRMDDAPFIVWLRHLEHAEGKIGDSASDVVSQEAWLESYFRREGDYYFLVESLQGIPLGTQGVYDMTGSSAESGRFIIRPGVAAALPTSVLLCDLFFDSMGLTEMRASSVGTNLTLHSYVRKLGFRKVRVDIGAQIIGGKAVDLVRFVLPAEDWPQIRERILPLARVAEQQVLTWEKAELQKKAAEPGENASYCLAPFVTCGATAE